MTLSRRSILKCGAAGAAAGIIGLRRKSAHADEPLRAKRVLLVNGSGGVRDSATFNASSIKDLNPWGVWGGAGACKLGNVLRSSPESLVYDAPSWPEKTIPDIFQAAASFSMIGAVDHAPNGFRFGDHTDDAPRMGTGYYDKDGAPGLLTVINKHLGGAAKAPVADVGGSYFAVAPGDWNKYAPTYLELDSSLDEPPSTGNPKVGRVIEDAFDSRLAKRRQSVGKGLVDTYLGTKASLRKFGPILANDALKFNYPNTWDAEYGGISNRMLLEAVGARMDPAGATSLTNFTYSGYYSARFATGIRLLQMGSPAVCIGMGGFDLHSDEESIGPDLYSQYGRYLAGIHFALSRIADPDDSNLSLLETTLVVTTSEFGRGRGGAEGFNDAHGSDHGLDTAFRNQSHVVFGAGITPKLLLPTKDDDPQTPEGAVGSTHALLATVCSAVGVPQDEIDAQWPPGSDLYPEAKPFTNLWD